MTPEFANKILIICIVGEKGRIPEGVEVRHDEFFSPYPLFIGRTLVILSFVARIRAPDVLAAAVNFATPPFFSFVRAADPYAALTGEKILGFRGQNPHFFPQLGLPIPMQP